MLVFHPKAKITTPWDVYENRKCDTNLDNGTCGLGIGKTMHRNIKDNQTLTAIDLMHMGTFKEKIKQISLKSFTHSEMPDWFAKEVHEFWEAVENIEWAIANYNFLEGYKTLIFEGSQGVLLDKDHGSFPNVTYSNTTSKNAMEICDILNITNRHVYGVTRAYHTRHGNGYFSEDKIELKESSVPETNVNNKYQGDFKIARLDYDLLDYAAAIETMYSIGYKQTLMVTCCNLVHEEDKFYALNLCSQWYSIKLSHSPYGEFLPY